MAKCLLELLEQEVACQSGVLEPLACRLGVCRWMPVQRGTKQGTREEVTEAMKSRISENQEGGSGLGKDEAIGRTLKNQWERLLAVEERGPKLTARV